MIINLLLNKNNLNLSILFHIIFGLICFYNMVFFVAFFYIILIDLATRIIKNPNRQNILLAISYVASLELLGRILSASPFVPYEVGKYFQLFLLLYATSRKLSFDLNPLIMLFLLIPSILTTVFYHQTSDGIIFNLLGPINIALGIFIFKGFKVNISILFDSLRLILFPILSIFILCLMNVSSLKDLVFTLNANFQVTAGFGSNQVSTMLGFGVIVLFIIIENGSKFSKNKFIDFFIMAILISHSLITFSRGGVLAIMVVLIAYFSLGFKKIINLFVVLIIGSGSFFFVNNYTDGLLLNRFKGETTSTLTNYRLTADLSTISSSRTEIFLQDVNLFYNNPIFGVGVGQSSKQRQMKDNSHIEFSRLLSEHGFFGLLYFLILLSYFRIKTPNYSYNAINMGFYIFSMYTMLHAGTRLSIVSLSIILAVIFITNNQVNEKYIVHRK